MGVGNSFVTWEVPQGRLPVRQKASKCLKAPFCCLLSVQTDQIVSNLLVTDTILVVFCLSIKILFLSCVVAVIYCVFIAFFLLMFSNCAFLPRFKDHPTLNDRYLLLHLLGRGGFSEVYKVNWKWQSVVCSESAGSRSFCTCFFSGVCVVVEGRRESKAWGTSGLH